MRRDLVIVLAAILLLNVIAIMYIQMKDIQVKEEPLQETPMQESREEAPLAANAASPKPLVEVLVLEDANCPECFDIRQYLEELDDVLNMSVRQGPAGPFAPPRLPALAFNASVELYPESFLDGWESFGYSIDVAREPYQGKWYVLPTLNAPYILNDTVYGQVDVTYIDMASCEQCYNVTINRAFLEESRVTLYDERFVDVESVEGSALRSRYNITRVPTILLTGDVDEYPNIAAGWDVVGTVEHDGAYVLRDLQRLRVTYYDLEKREVMRP